MPLLCFPDRQTHHYRSSPREISESHPAAQPRPPAHSRTSGQNSASSNTNASPELSRANLQALIRAQVGLRNAYRARPVHRPHTQHIRPGPGRNLELISRRSKAPKASPTDNRNRIPPSTPPASRGPCPNFHPSKPRKSPSPCIFIAQHIKSAQRTAHK